MSGPIAMAREAARRRVALKRWLRANRVPYRYFDTYNESALRKLVRDHHEGRAAAAGERA